jgi:hypothetical protein
MITISAPVDADVLTLRGEFLAMPGLCLTVVQTARLLSIREPHARDVLESLVGDGFLILTAGGLYRRPSVACGFGSGH